MHWAFWCAFNAVFFLSPHSVMVFPTLDFNLYIVDTIHSVRSLSLSLSIHLVIPITHSLAFNPFASNRRNQHYFYERAQPKIFPSIFSIIIQNRTRTKFDLLIKLIGCQNDGQSRKKKANSSTDTMVFTMVNHWKFMNVALAVDAIISNSGCIGKWARA